MSLRDAITVVQIGDLHLTTGPRNADRLAALDFVIEDAIVRTDIDAWLWPGDLTHTGMTIEIRNAIVARAIRMASVAPVFIAPGNHDPEFDLDFLAKLDTEYPINVVTEPGVVRLALRMGRGHVSIFCLPYPTKGGLVAAGTPHEGLNAAADAALDVIFMEAAGQLANARMTADCVMMIGHVNVAGSLSSVGQPQIGKEIEVTAAHLDRLGPCFKGLNHIHKHQQVGGAWYAGSLCRLDWGETEPKGYLIVRHERGAPDVAQQFVPWTYEVEFRTVPVAPMYHVDGLLTRESFAWRATKGPDGSDDTLPMKTCPSCTDSVIPPPLPDEAGGVVMACAMCDGRREIVDVTGCDVRVRASYASQERDVLATARERIHETFKDARRLDVEPLAIVTRELRAPEVIAATTFDEKLRAYAKLIDVSWTGTLDRCVTQLLASSNVEDGVTARLGPLAQLDNLDAQVVVVDEMREIAW